MYPDTSHGLSGKQHKICTKARPKKIRDSRARAHQKIPPRDFFLVDLIHASHAFVLDFHARGIAPTTRVGRQASCSSCPVAFSTCTSKKNTIMKVMRETVSGGGSRYFEGSRYFMTPGPKLVHAIQHQIFKEKKKKFARAARTNSRQWLPGHLEFFWSRLI